MGLPGYLLDSSFFGLYRPKTANGTYLRRGISVTVYPRIGLIDGALSTRPPTRTVDNYLSTFILWFTTETQRKVTPIGAHVSYLSLSRNSELPQGPTQANMRHMWCQYELIMLWCSNVVNINASNPTKGRASSYLSNDYLSRSTYNRNRWYEFVVSLTQFFSTFGARIWWWFLMHPTFPEVLSPISALHTTLDHNLYCGAILGECHNRAQSSVHHRLKFSHLHLSDVADPVRLAVQLLLTKDKL